MAFKHENRFHLAGVITKIFRKTSSGGKNFAYITVKTSVKVSQTRNQLGYHSVMAWDGAKIVLDNLKENQLVIVDGFIEYMKPKPGYEKNGWSITLKALTIEDCGMDSPPLEADEVPEADEEAMF